jgi:predicted dehydrogenase
MDRRDFLKSAAAVAAAPAVLARTKPNDTIGLAMIGVGTRGFYLFNEFQKIQGVEIRSICDLYDGNLKRARAASTNDRVKTGKEWEKVMADPDIDAVVIATPDFWHAPMTIRAAEAKKDVYVEKGWCLNLDQAKRMRAAIKTNHIVMQLGHNYNSMPQFFKGREIFRSGELGKVTAIRLYIDRTGVYPEWQFFQTYENPVMPADASPETIDWQRFTANTTQRPFNAERFFLWRKWFEYGNGIAGDLLSHLWDSANMVAGLGIPETTVTQGGNYFWKDGRDVPDQWNVLMDYPTKELSVSFMCTFNNRHYGEVEQYLGRDKTLEVSPRFCRTFPAEWKPGYKEYVAKNAPALEALGYAPGDAPPIPDYSMKRDELQVSSHWQDFIDCVRSRAMPRCGVDRAFEEAATIFLSVEAYKRNAKVRWDAASETIVNA